ncbi:MAG TPA: alanine--tRNA ligase, partial [Methylomirabilota bacterium]|nr:alanine--tRNA ligase [Methylomirabilota bacterium]
IPSASLVPANDPTVLFTTAGMQQFKPYYVGLADPLKDLGGQNAVSIQKCIRTSDIDEVGDESHLTFFEMLGNFSFGGYWKKEAIAYAHEFITKELGLKIDYVSVFAGDTEIPADEESRQIWQELNPTLKIKNHNREDNFWGPTGEEGPCGPTTEIYINGVEIWNIVFNEYFKTKEGKYEPLATKGIDTGMGLERLLVQIQKKQNVFETDLLLTVIDKVQTLANTKDIKSERIIADHLKAAVFLIADGVIPSNKDRGYILRRLIRRSVTYGQKLGIEQDFTAQIAEVILQVYSPDYPELTLNFKGEELKKEELKFRTTLAKGLKILEKKEGITGAEAFDLFQTYGFPFELTLEFANVQNPDEFEAEFKKHQELSRTASAGQFKGGLASHSDKIVRLHTAHHLLLAALQNIVGKEVKQRGSNITEDRLRLDFVCDHKLTDEEKQKVEDWVNEKIKSNLFVVRRELPLAEAMKIGAEMEFGAKYPDVVSIYFIEDKERNVFSKEFCGGPHVTHTGEIGQFKIQKEEAVSAGVRRIKAVVE